MAAAEVIHEDGVLYTAEEKRRLFTASDLADLPMWREVAEILRVNAASDSSHAIATLLVTLGLFDRRGGSRQIRVDVPCAGRLPEATIPIAIDPAALEPIQLSPEQIPAVEEFRNRYAVALADMAVEQLGASRKHPELQGRPVTVEVALPGTAQLPARSVKITIRSAEGA